MSEHTPESIKAKRHVYPLVKIWIWRCADEKCQYVKKSLGSEEGQIKVLGSGNKLREPIFSGDKCEECRVPATREACLLQVKLLHPENYAKGKGKASAPEDVEMEG
jgi:hypothetical protein